MTMTYSDVKAEVSLLADSLANEHREIASPLKAIRIAGRFPFAVLLTTVFAVVMDYVLLVYSVDKSNWDVSAYFEALAIVLKHGVGVLVLVTVGLSIFFTIFFYPTALIYSSLPTDVVSNSRILRAIKLGIKKISISLLLIVLIVDVVASVKGFYEYQYIGVAALCFAIFMFNMYIGSETLRYGLGPVTEMATKFINSKK